MKFPRMQGKTAHQPESCLGGGSAEDHCDDCDEDYHEDNTYIDVYKEVPMLMG